MEPKAETDLQLPQTVLRLYVIGEPFLQLRQGELGLSVFDADKLSEDDILPYFRSGSELKMIPVSAIFYAGLLLEKTAGDPNLPLLLQNNHWEIRKPEDMVRKRFKKDALSKLRAVLED